MYFVDGMTVSILRLWRSRTAMTMAYTTSRIVTVAAIVAGVVSTYSTATANVWLAFMTFLSLQIIADMGFSQSCIRIIAFACAGASKSQIQDMREVPEQARQKANIETLLAIRGTMQRTYARLAFGWSVFLFGGGSLALIVPIGQLERPEHAWAGWIIIAGASVGWIYGAQYLATLRGCGQVALQQRIGFITSIGQLVTSIIVLILGGGLFSLAIAYSCWFLVQVVVSASAANRVFSGLVGTDKTGSFDPDVFSTIWEKTWRSAIGIFMGYGLLQLSGLGYAQVALPRESAAYLLALRVLGSINQFALSPFNSKIPELASLRAANRIPAQIRVAQRSMRATYWFLVIGLVTVSLLAEPTLQVLGADMEFVSNEFWLLLGFGALVERFGAMHLQLYSTTNHILWHWANGITGVIYVVVAVTLLPALGLYAFPIAYCCGNLGFYSWFSSRLSYKSIGVSIWEFERSTVLLPGLFFMLSAGVVLSMI